MPLSDAMKRSVRKRPASGQDESTSNWAGELAVWYWDDGDPSNVEMQVYALGYNTYEDIWLEGSFQPWSDTDGDFTWFAHLGGTRYREGRTREGDDAFLQLVGFDGGFRLARQLTTEQRRCVRNCLKGKLRNSLRDAAIAGGVSLAGCALSVKLYFACVGITTMSTFAISLLWEFAWDEGCDQQCGLGAGGNDLLAEEPWPRMSCY